MGLHQWRRRPGALQLRVSRGTAHGSLYAVAASRQAHGRLEQLTPRGSLLGSIQAVEDVGRVSSLVCFLGPSSECEPAEWEAAAAAITVCAPSNVLHYTADLDAPAHGRDWKCTSATLQAQLAASRLVRLQLCAERSLTANRPRCR